MQESLCPCAFVRACVCVCGCVYIFSPFKCKQTGCKTFCFSLNYHFKKKSNVSTYTEYSCTQSETTTHTHTHTRCTLPSVHGEHQCEAQNKAACEFGQVSVSEATFMRVFFLRWLHSALSFTPCCFPLII